MKKLFVLLSVLILYSLGLHAQHIDLTSIKGLPSKEVYDLLIDKKGFLWIAHDLGLTRFDGITMTNYANKNQTSLSISDLREDESGTIWCHNFTGQIFYVKNEKLYLHRGYNALKEVKFPRILIYENELVASSKSGLYTYDLRTQMSKYFSNSNQGVSSLTVANKQIIAFGNGKWFSYTKRNGIKELKSNFSFPKSDYFYLHPVTAYDTLFATHSFSGQLYKLVLEKDTVKLIRSKKYKDFINTITVDNASWWVHTKKNTYQINGEEVIKDLDLTDIVEDHEGNTWYSSLKNGLFVKYKPTHQKSNIIKVETNDFIRSMGTHGDLIVFGTQKGKIILYNKTSNKIILSLQIPSQSGAVEKIENYFNGDFLIAGSVGNWLLHSKNGTLTLVDEMVLKGICIYENILFRATSVGLIVKPHKASSLAPLRTLFPSLAVSINYGDSSLIEEGRCRALEYVSSTKTLYAALQNGLVAINKSGKSDILYENQKLNISSLENYNNTLFAGDFNKGLFILKGQKIKNISTANGLLSNTILKLKVLDNNLWIITTKGLQLFDIKKGVIINELGLQQFNGETVYDVLEVNNKVWVATSEGTYEVAIRQKLQKISLKNYLLYALINYKDTIENGVSLPFNQNNIQFNLSAPWFNNPANIFFKYRLIGERNTKWIVADERQRIFNYAALMPGKYTFEASATSVNGESASELVRFDFVIEKPWWEKWWFISLGIFLLVGILFMIINGYYRLRLLKEKANYEQLLALETERQRISTEIHDDISAGLAALKLYTGLTEQKTENTNTKKDLSKIYISITNLSSQLREVIWALNTEHNSLENLIYYLHQQTTALLEKTNINLTIHLPTSIVDKKIIGEKRKHIYLAVKEVFQNILKHANATEVIFNIVLDKNSTLLYLVISDNGIGFKGAIDVESMGIKNIKRRISILEGQWNLESEIGVKITLSIPI